jgi:cytochrome c-type biogenesis protein CcmH
MIRRVLCLIAAAMMLSAFADPMPSLADDPKLYLQDAKQEARARELFHEIRCVVCQNETIAGSNAPIAQQMRQIVREQIAAGRTDAQIKDHLRQRWGDFVLLKPRFTARTAILWILPFAIVVTGLLVIVLRRPRTAPSAPADGELTAEELKALKQLQENSASGGAA